MHKPADKLDDLYESCLGIIKKLGRQGKIFMDCSTRNKIKLPVFNKPKIQVKVIIIKVIKHFKLREKI